MTKISEGKKTKAVITLGLLSDMIIVRATKPILPVSKIISNLQEKIPTANMRRGHECGRTIKFIQRTQKKYWKKLKKWLGKYKLIWSKERILPFFNIMLSS